MTFPTVNNRNDGKSAATQTNHVLNLPSGITAGKLLVMYFVNDDNETPGWPAGWTQIAIASTSLLTQEARYRVADGSEGSTITVTTGTARASAHRSWMIGGHNASTNAPEGTTAQGSSTTPDPPLETASFGSGDHLWLACTGMDAADVTVSGFPSGYGAGPTFSTTAGISSDPWRILATAERQFTSSNDNPGTFTISASTPWRAMTIVIPTGTEGTGAGAVVVRRTLLGVGV